MKVPEREVLEECRKALSDAGYCGDGYLPALIKRALEEAEAKGKAQADSTMSNTIQEIVHLCNDTGLDMPKPVMTLADRVRYWHARETAKVMRSLDRIGRMY